MVAVELTSWESTVQEVVKHLYRFVENRVAAAGERLVRRLARAGHAAGTTVPRTAKHR